MRGHSRPGRPGPPLRAQLIGAVRGLFVHHDEEEDELTEEQARRP